MLICPLFSRANDYDVNGDGNVTAADVTALYDYLLNNDLTHAATCDVTGDGTVTSADVTAVYDVLLNGIPATPVPERLVGGDISMLTKYEQGGAIYKDRNGSTIASVLPYFKQQGWNAMRVRLFVNPENASDEHKKEGVVQDLPYVKALGKRIKDAGYALVLDLHYSDTWADPGKQTVPAAWPSNDVEALKDSVYNYTKRVLQQMIAAGARPDFIQLGNEITGGMLWPTGQVYPTGGAPAGGSWENFAAYQQRASQAVREVSPSTKIILHVEMHNLNQPSGFFGNCESYGIDYDVMGLSYYSAYHGDFANLNTVLSRMEVASTKPIMMRKLEERMGEDGLRDGLKLYLRTFKYGSSSWNELISILDSIKPSADIKKFDREWVKSKGVKTIEWNLDDGLPNFDGTDYARYLLKDSTYVMAYINMWDELKTDQSQLAAIMTIYENWLAHRAPANLAFTAYWMLAASISNEQVLSVCGSYLNAMLRHMSAAERPLAETLLFETIRRHPVQSFRQKLLRGLSRNCISPEITDSIYVIWEKADEPLLNERDYMRIAYHLMINKPNRRLYIEETQLKRLSSEDRRKEFEFICQGCTPDTLQQRRIFESLLQAENRKVEPYAAELLTLLADADRGPHVEQYVGPGLEIIEEIQRTGDIFFPLDWCESLLYGQRSKAAADAVVRFLDTHPTLSYNLRGKILQAAYPLLNRFN